MKILAIQNRMGIGDMIIYLPFIEAIAKKYNTKVDILVKANSKAKEILKFNNYLTLVNFIEGDCFIFCHRYFSFSNRFRLSLFPL